MAGTPLILVSPSIEKRGVEFHDLSVSLSFKYENAVLQAGGIPVTVPTTTDRRVLAEMVRRVDGVLLTGGDDINPGLYTRKLPRAVRQTVDTTPDGGGRDLRELMLIEEIFRQRKPLLAICRGHQLLNIALGGGLVADIRRQVPGALNHQRLDKASELVHEVALTSGSLLARIVRQADFGREQLASSGCAGTGGTADGRGASARWNCGSDGIETGCGAANAVFVERAISSRTADANGTPDTARFFRGLSGVCAQKVKS